MRRFSQRNSLVTLNEINITPLLDLAFVLLIIFIITRPLLEQSIEMKLPPGGKPPAKVNAKDFRTVEISSQGIYKFNNQRFSPNQIVNELEKAFRVNPNLVVHIRSDENTPYKFVAAIMDGCQKKGMTRLAFKTAPEGK